jgi:integrase
MSRRAKQTFTQGNIRSLPRGPKVGKWYTSADLPGFGLVVDVRGGKRFVVRYKVRGERRRRVETLGKYGVITFNQARKKAREILASASLGEDPRPRRKVPTWAEWTKRYLERLDAKRPEEPRRYLGRSAETNPRTGAATDDLFRSIARKWAAVPLDELTVEDVEQARARVRERGKTTATLWLATVSACLSAAVRAELIERNPAAKVKPERPNPPRSRVLSPDEMKALLEAAYAEPDPYARAAVLLLAMTGARSGEILAAEWPHVDFEGRRISLPDSKSDRPRFIPLPAPALELLRELPRFGRYVIAGARKDRPRANLKSVWRRVSARAGLEGVNAHDVRRTYGLEVSRLAGLRVASLALGHATIKTTETTYAPEGFAAIQDATDRRAALLPLPEAEKKDDEGGRP